MRHRAAILAFAALAACNEGHGVAPDGPDGMTKAAQPSAPAARQVAPTSVPIRKSAFTSLDPATCATIEESDEGPYWRRRCEGVGGFSVEWTESDLRQNILVVSPNGMKTSLDLPSRVAGGAFDRLGSRIEWRGEAGKVPDVIVVRVHVANAEGKDDSGRLAVARLTPTPCLVGIVAPQPDQSGKARAIADQGAACLESGG